MIDELATRGNHLDPSDFCVSWKDYGLDKRPFSGTRRNWTVLTRLLLDIPEGMQIDHLCRNVGCIRTDHLEIVTNRENILRGKTGERVEFCKKCGSNDFIPHKTSCDGVSRRCRICRQRGDRRRYRAKNCTKIACIDEKPFIFLHFQP